MAILAIAGSSQAQQVAESAERTATVAVVVARAAEGTVQGAGVLVLEPGTGRVLARAMTDAAGRAVLRASRAALKARPHPWGPVEIVVDHAEHATWSQVRPFGDSAEVGLTARRTVAGIVHIIGSGDPKGIEVRLGGSRYRGSVTTGPGGHFRWVDAPIGRLTLWVNAPRYWPTSATVVAGPKAHPLAIRLEPLPAITGEVVDREGHPLAGAQLHVPDRLEPVQTDRNGRFAARLRMEERSLGPQGYAVAQRLLQVYVPGYAIQRYRIRKESDNRIVMATRVPPLRVLLRDPSGQPIAGGRIEMLTITDAGVPLPPIGRALERSTDPAGQCVFAVRPAGRLALVARAKSFVPRMVETAESSRRLEIELARGREIEGRVVRAGATVVGARVSALVGLPRTADEVRLWQMVAPLSSWREAAVAYSDPEGRFVIRGVPRHALGAMATLSRVLRSSFVPAADEVGDLVLGGPLAIQGRLASDRTGSLSGVTVQCRAASGGRLREVVTDRNGAYRFDALDPGRYCIEAYPRNHAPLRLTVWAGDRCDLRARSLVGDRELRIRFSGSVSGHGDDAVVALSRRIFPRIERHLEVPLGRVVRFKDLLSGPYEVSVLVPGYERLVRPVNLPPNGVGPFDCEIPLKLGAPTKVTTVPGARLSIETIRGRKAPGHYVAGRDGTVLARELGPGSYRLISRAAGYLTCVRDIDATARRSPRGIDMRVGKASTLRVFVSGARGKPVRGARLGMETDSGAEIETSVLTGADGSGVLRDLVAGRLTIRAVVGEQEGTVEVEVQPGRSLEARIRIGRP